MFAHFHRSLAMHADKLQGINASWLLDCRGQSDPYIQSVMALYMTLNEASKSSIESHIETLKSESNKMQLPGFFLSNNTDYDWRNYNEPTAPKSRVIGKVIDVKKSTHLLIEWHEPLSFPISAICYNPDHSTVEFSIESAESIIQQQKTKADAFETLIHPWQKYIQKKSNITF